MTKQFCENVIKTVNILAAPIAAAIAVWVDFDVAVYVAAIAQMINSAMQGISVFLKK